jgi:catechol 2,3-dioxygenase-like lactoylglutathione lyase family enzyme
MKANLQGIHPVLASNDIEVSVQFYRRLGFSLSFQDDPTHSRYAVVHRDDVELYIQWAESGSVGVPNRSPSLPFHRQ